MDINNLKKTTLPLMNTDDTDQKAGTRDLITEAQEREWLIFLRFLMSSKVLGYRRSCFNISRAAFAPDPPVKPAPGCVPEPHKYRFCIGVL